MRKQRPAIEAKLPHDHAFFALIEEAYHVFAYPKPLSTDVCERCCMDAAIAADFFNPPIRELPLEYVQDWFNAAYSGEGISKETWAYLLPRILEILAADKYASVISLEISLRRFETGNPENWSNEEWKILDNFQRQFLAYKIGSGPDALDDVICMFQLAGWHLEGLLGQVERTSDAALAQRLWHDWCRGHESIWITAFWESPDNTAVFEFYTSQKLYNRMTALAFAHETAPELASRALAVASVIEAAARA